jgi:hypothetical protein
MTMSSKSRCGGHRINFTAFVEHQSTQPPNARICMLTEVGLSRKLEPIGDAGEAVLEL